MKIKTNLHEIRKLSLTSIEYSKRKEKITNVCDNKGKCLEQRVFSNVTVKFPVPSYSIQLHCFNFNAISAPGIYTIQFTRKHLRIKFGPEEF